MRNTKEKGSLRFMVYPATRKGYYTAVCLDLAIIREGKDVLALKKRIEILSMKYLSNVIKHNLSDDLLNQDMPKKYLKKFEDITKAKQEYENQDKWQKALDNLIWQTQIVRRNHTLA